MIKPKIANNNSPSFDTLSGVRMDGVRHDGLKRTIGRSLRWPTSRGNNLQHLPSDQRTSPPGKNPAAPSFVDISRMPSMSELAIKVFLRTSHPTMPT
jgi:hypothetical protein